MNAREWFDEQEANMRVLVVEHHDKPTIGLIGPALHDLGLAYRTMWGLFDAELPRNAQAYDAIIVLGGSMSALDDERCPYFPALVDLIRAFAEAGKPVMGVCLGAQLIARSFDAELRVGGELEFGFHTVRPTENTAADPVLGHLDGPLPLFQWHTDHYELPPGAERLASGDRYRNQAFRIGRNVYGMQFHFEVTRQLVEQYIAEMPSLNEEVPDHDAWLPEQFRRHEGASGAFCRAAIRKWIELDGRAE